MEKNNKVLLGMSGGVDSSVAAYILKEQGYDVIGITLKLWEGESERENQCCSLSAVEDARSVANTLGIPFYVLNFKDIFREKVVDYFIEEYDLGRTPNPCIACNKHIKFTELLKKAEELGAYYVATGHYAKIERNNENNRFILRRSDAVEKDQTYALYNMTQYQLEHTLMPLGEMSSKDKVREIAKKLGLVVSNKPDSQDICFIEDGDYGKFLDKHSKEKPKKGKFLDVDGKIVGEHIGIRNYTIGQRKGLGLALGYPAYVIDIDKKKNIVIVGKDNNAYKNELIATEVNCLSISEIKDPIEVEVKIRYSAKPEKAIITPINETDVKIEFEKPVRAITPGQAVVFYKGDIVVGGGIICYNTLV